ncbi:hypothetical protein AB6A40_009453 [Gnathostoma spinigerum]|uniref:Uncharacterized protein n=1 Tax=Gnathostoma spinigerum TaxID=75299 RepID=A0ABD6EZJ6_9BILA
MLQSSLNAHFLIVPYSAISVDDILQFVAKYLLMSKLILSATESDTRSVGDNWSKLCMTPADTRKSRNYGETTVNSDVRQIICRKWKMCSPNSAN